MPITITLERDKASAVLDRAAQTRCATSMRVQRSHGDVSTYETAIASVQTKGLFVERPTGPDGPVEIAPGETVRLVFSEGEDQYGVEASVRGSGTVAVDAKTEVDVIELAEPERVYQIQRRADYRVPLWSTKTVTAHFEPLPVGSSHDLPPAEAFHAELQNISAGGVAALISPSVRACLAAGQHYLMDFFLPGCDDPFAFAVCVQHIRRLSHSDARLIGLRFLPGDDSEATRRAIHQIRSYVDVHRRLKG